MVFTGGHEYSLDDKSRIVIPPAFRKGLGADFVVTKGSGRCLFVFPKDYWEAKFESVLAELPMLNAHAIRIQRFFCAEAMTGTNIDSQGRIAISSTLREFAGLKTGSPNMILGMLKRVEIWDKAAWTAVRDATTDEDLSESADQVGLGHLLAI